MTAIAGASRMSSVRGLKARPHTATVLPASPPRCAATRGTSTAFCASFVRSTASTTCRRSAGLLAHPDERLHVLREARAAVADPGEQERRADPAVRAHAHAHLPHVRAHPVAVVRDLVHERDAGGQHGVGRVLRELGRGRVHHQDRLAGADEGLVELPHDRLDLRVVGADDHPVRLQEVVDRRPLLQELGVRDHRERVAGERADRPRAPAPRSPPAPWTC